MLHVVGALLGALDRYGEDGMAPNIILGLEISFLIAFSESGLLS